MQLISCTLATYKCKRIKVSLGVVLCYWKDTTKPTHKYTHTNTQCNESSIARVVCAWLMSADRFSQTEDSAVTWYEETGLLTGTLFSPGRRRDWGGRYSALGHFLDETMCLWYSISTVARAIRFSKSIKDSATSWRWRISTDQRGIAFSDRKKQQIGKIRRNKRDEKKQTGTNWGKKKTIGNKPRQRKSKVRKKRTHFSFVRNLLLRTEARRSAEN